MPSLSYLLLNFLELRAHAVASGFPFDLELSAAVSLRALPCPMETTSVI